MNKEQIFVIYPQQCALGESQLPLFAMRRALKVGVCRG